MRWIGPPSTDSPAPTIDVSRADGPMLDVTGGDAGPPASAAGMTIGRAPAAASGSGGGASKGLAIAGLVAGLLGLAAGGLALLRSGWRTRAGA